MATSSRGNFHRKNPSQNDHLTVLKTSLSLALANQEPLLNSEYSGHNSASSRSETLPAALAVAVKIEDEGKEANTDDASNLQIICHSQIPEDLTVWDVVKDDVAIVASKMKAMPERPLEELKIALRMLMEDTDDQSHVAQFVCLQKNVQIRPDLTSATLQSAHHVQLEILVALKMGIPAYLHESVSVPRSRLAEIFFYERCKNMSCQSVLPAEDCDCGVCCCRRGFCNLCMCVICNGFDFDVNTCRWIGCDGCSHWTHTDCAIREEQIKTVITVNNGVAHAVTVFICKACHGTSELLGWVRNVFQHCAKIWGTAALSRELEYVQEVFSVSEDSKGKKLFEKCTDLIERLKIIEAESMSPGVLLQALQEIELDDAPEITENEEQVQQNTDPHETCNNQLSAYVQEDATNKKARLSVEAITDGELEKAKAAEQLQLMAAEGLRQKKQEAEELDRVVRLKQAESEMFHVKAKEAQEEAEQLQLASMAKLAKAERDYTDMYLKHRLEEAEAEKQLIFHKLNTEGINQQTLPPPPASSSGGGVAPTQNAMLCKILDALSGMPPPSSSESAAAVSKVHELLREALSMPCSSGCTTVDDVQHGRGRADDPLQMMMLNEIYDMVIGMTKTTK